MSVTNLTEAKEAIANMEASQKEAEKNIKEWGAYLDDQTNKLTQAKLNMIERGHLLTMAHQLLAMQIQEENDEHYNRSE